MKTIKTLALAALAALLFTSCQKDETPNQNVEKDYNFDIKTAVSSNYFEAESNKGSVTVKSNLPFDVTILDRNASNWTCDPKTRPTFEIQFTANNGSTGYTRDLIAYMRTFEICKIKGYGNFYYPILIRQRGEKGTRALTKEEIVAYNKDQSNDWSGNNDQHYVVGKLVSVSSITNYAGLLCNNGMYIYAMSPEPTNIYGTAWNLEACDLVVDVDGEQITLKAVFEKPYELVSDMTSRIKAGDMVEVNVTNRGIHKGFNGIFVHPLSVRKIDAE